MTKEYVITSVSHSGEKGTRGLPRTDGKYPERVGSVVKFDIKALTIGEPFILTYVKDKDGNDRNGFYLRISGIQGAMFSENEGGTIETKNSIYEFAPYEEGSD